MTEQFDYIEARALAKGDLVRFTGVPPAHLGTTRGPDGKQAWADECSQWSEYNRFVSERNKELRRFENALLAGTPFYKTLEP